MTKEWRQSKEVPSDGKRSICHGMLTVLPTIELTLTRDKKDWSYLSEALNATKLLTRKEISTAAKYNLLTAETHFIAAGKLLMHGS